jgi:hypothetical protein
MSVFHTLPSRADLTDFALLLKKRDAIVNPEDDTRLGALEWARRYGVIRTATGRVFPFREVERDYQTEILSSTAKAEIVGKSRQLGISNTYAFVAAEEATAGGTVLVVSKSLDQAALFLEYVYTALSDAPHPEYTAQNKYSLKFSNGGQVICQPATKRAGRGIPATIVILDEFAWQHYARDIYTAILPTLATTGGRLIILSTPYGVGNLFQELWAFSQTPIGEKIWRSFFLPWQRHPDWDDEWAAKMRVQMGPIAFAQEHDVDFQGSGENIFSSVDLDLMFTMPEFLDPAPNHRYVSAFDIARKRDAFAGWTIDISTSPFTLVNVEHHYRMDYPQQAEVIEAVTTTYPGPEPLVESNGPGDPLIQFLKVQVEPFFTTAINKKNAIDALQLLVSNGELKSAPHTALRQQLTQYIRDDQGIEQDLVMAGAMAALKAGKPIRDNSVFAGGERGVALDSIGILAALAGSRSDPSAIAALMGSQTDRLAEALGVRRLDK